MHRIDEDQEPACVEACREAGHDALVFGDLEDAAGPLASLSSKTATRELRPDLKLNTGVRYTSF